MKFILLVTLLLIGWSPWANAGDTENYQWKGLDYYYGGVENKIVELEDKTVNVPPENVGTIQRPIDEKNFQWKGLDYYYEQETTLEKTYEVNQ